jgi:3-deoxy-manno-octulosonate cytidylyltransferase (CMP-KDO synthetase)
MTKIIGVVPVRMASSRFPGKPLYKIAGFPMVVHVMERAKMYKKWDALYLATCDEEIREFAESKGYTVIMTSDKHTRALDRVAEAIKKCDLNVEEDDLVLCVQGDEPMMRPDMIDATIEPFNNNKEVNGTVLAMHIIDETIFKDPNAVKIVHNIKGDILYTSRMAVPYCKDFTAEHDARRIYGIFGFRWHYLKSFTDLPESPLELKESCDSNRFYDNGMTQRIAPYPFIESFSVDVKADAENVEKHIINDFIFKKYNGLSE